jgi:hypothetical protein
VDAGIFYLCSRAYSDLGDLLEAVADMTRAIERESGDSAYFVSRCEDHFAAERLRNGLRHLQAISGTELFSDISPRRA